MACTETRRKPDFGEFIQNPVAMRLVIYYSRQEFVAAPALAPPEVQVDENVLKQYHDEMTTAAAMPLPDESDPDL